jgi:hypothetical protein
MHAARSLIVWGGLSLLAAGCAKQFNDIGNQQQNTPTPVITNVVYDQAMNITGSNFDSLLSQINVGGQLASGFIFRKDPSTGVESLHNPAYRTPSGLDNPANITVTVNGKISNAWSYLFYPQITGFSPDSAIGNSPITITGMLFGSRTVASSVKAFYYDVTNLPVYMSPDPAVVSWTTNAIQVTMPAYTTYPTGRPLLSFQIYLEVDVSTKNNSQEVQYFR